MFEEDKEEREIKPDEVRPKDDDDQ